MDEIVLYDLQLFSLPELITAEVGLPAPGNSIPCVELILFCSSGEFGVLHQAWIAEWITRSDRLLPKQRRAFVSMACASWYAALLEFMRSDCGSAEIWVIEASADFIQERLDSAGLGPDGEGLLATSGIARMCLRKGRALSGEVVLDACTLFSKPAGLRGMELLIKRYAQWLIAHMPESGKADWISFAIATDWSRQLQVGLSLWGEKVMRAFVAWPSFEQGNAHLMAMKPLHELTFHLQQPLVRPVVLTTLAAGGRIGSAIFRSKEAYNESRCRPTNISPILLPPIVLPAGMPPHYCMREYRYRDNEYFLTELDGSGSALSMYL